MENQTIDEVARRRQVRQRLIQLREAVIDWDIAVDDARVDLDRSLERFKVAVANRDAAAQQLAVLIDATAA